MHTVSADLRHLAALWNVAPRRRWVVAIGKVILYPRVRAVVWFRISQSLWRHGLRPLALVVQGHILRISGAELHPGAEIGAGFCLVHSSGVVIGPGSRIGADFVLHQGVTLGSRGRDGAEPTIADQVTIYAGAKVLGAVSIGTRAEIGANAVVVDNVPDGGVAVGIPARVISIRPTPTI